MPWSEYAGMTDDGLRALFAYPQTLAPVDNAVVVRPWQPFVAARGGV